MTLKSWLNYENQKIDSKYSSKYVYQNSSDSELPSWIY
jgi:hypothetical protein